MFHCGTMDKTLIIYHNAFGHLFHASYLNNWVYSLLLIAAPHRVLVPHPEMLELCRVLLFLSTASNVNENSRENQVSLQITLFSYDISFLDVLY